MRISDWSSDVCSSDLIGAGALSQLSRRAWIASAVISQGLIEIERRALHPDQWPGMANPYISIASEACSPHPFRYCPTKAGIISRAHGTTPSQSYRTDRRIACRSCEAYAEPDRQEVERQSAGPLPFTLRVLK